MTTTPRVLASTTSHKREPLLPTLEIFGRLGLSDVDLNLHHIIEDKVPVADVKDAVKANSLKLWVLSGGWCDFYKDGAEVLATFESVARQVSFCEALGVSMLRLFFGRLHRDEFTPAAFDTIAANLTRLSEAHPNVRFVFENHDGASLDPDVCRDVLERVDRPNIRMNFDPINFAKAGVEPMTALDRVRPFISHVHLKGLSEGHYCEFGAGDVALAPVIASLLRGGYKGRFTVEYEGHHDGTLRLFQSVQRARAEVDA